MIAPRRRAICSAALAALGSLLAFAVISHTLLAHLAEVAPEAALALDPGHPAALAEIADRALRARTRRRGNEVHEADGGPAAERPHPAGDTIGEQAAQAVAGDPLDARALRILGQLAAEAGEDERAGRLMLAAVRRSAQESAALRWLLWRRLRERDHAGAIAHADALLRTRPQAGAPVLAVLARLAEDEQSAPVLAGALARNPPWRGSFLSAAAERLADPRALVALLEHLQASLHPITQDELRACLDALVGRRAYELAYYTWLRFLPRAWLRSAGFVFNGSFEIPASGLPFDWAIGRGSGAAAEVGTPPGSKARALLVRFGPGRVEALGVAQLLLLPPGQYEFAARYRGRISGRRGSVWRIECAGSEALRLGESPPMDGTAPAWREARFTLAVPPAGCPAQYLRLELDARSPSERLVSGAMWYDEVRIARAASGR